MAEGYPFIDINAKGEGIVVAAFDNQVAYCTKAGATVTARVVAALRDLLERGEPGRLLDAIRVWPGAPLADALPLRVAGGIHALHLKGVEPDLATIYEDRAGVDDAAIVAAAIRAHEADLMPWLDGPPGRTRAGVAVRVPGNRLKRRDQPDAGSLSLRSGRSAGRARARRDAVQAGMARQSASGSRNRDCFGQGLRCCPG
jgi:hypothetical protein